MRHIIVLTALLLAAGPALAAEPAYVGSWGVDAAQCKLTQDVQGAPMIVTAKGYDQHEAHCTFTSVKRNGAGWKVVAACSVEGDKQKYSFSLKVDGGKLTMIEGRNARTFIRCQ